ncbi:MAG TPA: dienelactone hydrolase family protein [Ignavibacteriaceae bacterium]
MKYAVMFLLSILTIYGCSGNNEKSVNTGSSIVTKDMSYSSDGTTLKGFLAYDSSKTGKMPGILVVHEWWGLNNYARQRAEQLAKMGYVAFAIDMYGNGTVVEHPKDAGEFAMSVMRSMDTARARFDAGLQLLKEQPQTDTGRIAAIGYCFGGGIVLRMALEGENLNGIVSFHGDLPTDNIKNPENVKSKILVCTGGADPFNPAEKVESFEKVMKEANIKYNLISYPGAMHSFTNPAADSLGKKFNIPLAYNKEADEKSWEAMQSFFSEIFK